MASVSDGTSDTIRCGGPAGSRRWPRSSVTVAMGPLWPPGAGGVAGPLAGPPPAGGWGGTDRRAGARDRNSRTYYYFGWSPAPRTRSPATRRAWTPYRPAHPVRFVTAASLFDGHDAAINIMRRLLQAQGAEVDPPGPQPLGRRGGRPRRSRRTSRGWPSAPTRAATSSTSATWSTGCASRGRPDIRVYGGGGGVIVPAEIAELEALRRGPDLLPGRRPAAGPRRAWSTC